MHRHLFYNLWQGVRLALLRNASPRGGLSQLLVLLLLGWLCALSADWMSTAPPVILAPWGILAEAARAYWWLAVLAVVVTVERDEHWFVPLAVLLAAANFIIWSVWLAVVLFGPRLAPAQFGVITPYLWQVAFGWQVAVFVRALGTRRGHKVRDLLYTGAYAGVLYLCINTLPDYPLWETKPARVSDALNIEDTYQSQPRLLADALARIVPSRAGARELFVVTFAGFGAEDVFKREALNVSKIVGTRFGADTRRIELINNSATLPRWPLASVSNLSDTLNALVTKMQTDEDILFLFLTSHGSEDGEFAVELGELGLNALTPERLRDMLDAAGIKWRVLVVSSCYSGQFIDALESPDTLVITAAARDRTSFGCAHENEWTYFGEAYFARALRNIPSFTQAFTRARERIAKREQRAGNIPSEPQIRLGKAIAPVLKDFEHQLSIEENSQPKLPTKSS